jgi:type 1 glutamine amidotransferase
MRFRGLTFSCLILFLGVAGALAAASPKKVLLLAGKSSHGYGQHEHMPGMRVLAKCLSDVPGLEAEVCDVGGAWPEGPELIEGADGIVMYLDYGMRWEQSDPDRQAALEALRNRGGGVVALHWAVGGRNAADIPFHLKLVGGCHGGPDRKYTHADAELAVAAPDHPVVTGIEDFRLNDEYYYQLKWAQQGKVVPLLTGTIADCPDQAVAWAFERPDGGRSMGFVCMHSHQNWGRAECRRLIAQGVLWTLKLPVPQQGLPVAVDEKDLALPPPNGK